MYPYDWFCGPESHILNSYCKKVHVMSTITTHAICSKVKNKYCVIYGEIFIVFNKTRTIKLILKSQLLAHLQYFKLTEKECFKKLLLNDYKLSSQLFKILYITFYF